MSRLALRLGPLSADTFAITRSSLRWLIEPGQHVRANQPFAYCNINLEPTALRVSGPSAFADEADLQVAFAARVGGIVRPEAALSRGGYLNVRSVERWDPDTILASIDPDGDVEIDEGIQTVRLLMLAGRRMNGLVDVHAGLLPGWHSRSRGWWCDQGEMPVTLLSMGICDATGVILGEHYAFLEMFEAAPIAAQMVFVPDHPLTPVAPVLLDQLVRKTADIQAISSDLRRFLSDASAAPNGDDWMVAGALLSALQRSPITDRYALFSPSGLQRTRPADALLLSLSAEPQTILRHKSLGYHLHMMRHHQAAAGPALRAWIAAAFEPVKRTMTDISRDYELLFDEIQRQTSAAVLVINRMSTSGYENISSYAAFDAPMSDSLANIAAKELNLVLHDLAERRGVSIIDVDAMAAAFGGAEHLSDGIHQSGALQAALRADILSVLSSLAAPQVISNSTGKSAAPVTSEVGSSG